MMMRSAAGSGTLPVRIQRAHNVCMLATWTLYSRSTLRPAWIKSVFDQELERCLFQDFASMRYDEHTLTGFRCLLDDVGSNNGFTSTSRQARIEP